MRFHLHAQKNDVKLVSSRLETKLTWSVQDCLPVYSS